MTRSANQNPLSLREKVTLPWAWLQKETRNCSAFKATSLTTTKAMGLAHDWAVSKSTRACTRASLAKTARLRPSCACLNGKINCRHVASKRKKDCR